ncbi:MAG: ATP synthase F1 subunit delta [Dysgonamonadaceae bacterium]|jgi:F-type H+-transporting ATPase subunit delta|nr:ATP synthase F1 subunit delta [Dysgonamonadaceae bacterium]
MDAGKISTRYAKAIYAYASERGEAGQLRKEFKTLSAQFNALPTLKLALDDPTVPAEKKISALLAAVGSSASESYCKTVNLIIGNGRGHYAQQIALVYDRVYRRENRIIVANLLTVEPAAEAMKSALKKLVSDNPDETVDFHAETDAAIIGGFVLEIDDIRLDASVKNQLNTIKLELTK